MDSHDILANAKRLISDAQYLRDAGSERSAATFVLGLEQLGACIEATAREKNPETVVHMGLFGDKANAHSTRQDALAAHVFGWKMGNYAEQFTAEIFTRRTMGCCDIDQYHRWLTRSTPISFSTEQKDRMRDDRELSAAGFLMRLTRQNRLRDLREFGTYQDSNCRFSDAAVHQVIELAGAISKMVETSRDRIAPAPIKLFDPNWP